MKVSRIIIALLAVILVAISCSTDFDGKSVLKRIFDKDIVTLEEESTEYTISYSGLDPVSDELPKSYTRYKDASKNEAVVIDYKPSKTGFRFKGWKLESAEDSEAAGSYTISAETTGDIALVAVWDMTLEAITDVGQEITLGDIDWVALEVDSENSRALLISQEAIKDMEFDTNGTTSKYKDSSIRQYLNGIFLTDYSLDSKYVAKVDLATDTEKNIVSDTGDDLFFLLSATEVNGFIEDTITRSIVLDYKGLNCYYWLRTEYTDSPTPGWPFVNSVRVCDTTDWNSTIFNSPNKKEGMKLRPAFWYTWK